MELDIIKVNLEKFKSEDSLHSFLSTHNKEIFDKSYCLSIYINYIYETELKFIYIDVNTGVIIKTTNKNGDDEFTQYKIEFLYTQLIKPTNIITLIKKPKSLSQLSSTDLEKELELCLESEDYERAIEIRVLMGS